LSKRALAALVACLAIAAAVAGCGGGGDSTSSGDTGGGESTEASGPAPAKAVFIKEADGICRKADGELTEEIVEYAEENGIETGKEPTQAQQAEIIEQVVLPNLGRQGEEISGLTPPEGDEGTVGEIVDALQEGVEEGESDPQALIEGENPLEDASKKATAYGLKVCGSEG
jgi:hypothetical protein